MQLVEENAFVVCYFQSVYVNPIRFVRFLESIHSFFSSPIGRMRPFVISIVLGAISEPKRIHTRREEIGRE